jgi:hypothetical protein
MRTMPIANFIDVDGHLDLICIHCSGRGDNPLRAAADLLAYWPVWKRRQAESAACLEPQTHVLQGVH